MFASSFQTYFLPLVPNTGNSPPPVCIATAGKVPMRVFVRVPAGGGVVAGVAFDTTSIVTTASSIYLLIPNTADSFVLAPGQSLFAASFQAEGGVAGPISVACSEAVPVKYVLES